MNRAALSFNQGFMWIWLESRENWQDSPSLDQFSGLAFRPNENPFHSPSIINIDFRYHSFLVTAIYVRKFLLHQTFADAHFPFLPHSHTSAISIVLLFVWIFFLLLFWGFPAFFPFSLFAPFFPDTHLHNPSFRAISGSHFFPIKTAFFPPHFPPLLFFPSRLLCVHINII